MNDETRQWLRYARENREAATVMLESSLFNPCLQNAQQAIEKLLKALLIEFGAPLRRTHSIRELAKLLRERDVEVALSEDDCDLLDAVYLPSKYPLGSALPDFEPDDFICTRCLAILNRLEDTVERILGSQGQSR